MPKTFIINIDYNYPFDLQQKSIPPESNIKVLRRIALSQLNGRYAPNKIRFVQTLRNKNLVKVESVKEIRDSIQICFQFVRAFMNARDEGFWRMAIPQLQGLAQYLANIGVRTSFKPERMCITKQGILKFYLGLEFEHNEDEDEQYLQSHYRNQIQIFLKLYKQPENRIVQYRESKNSKENQILQKYRKASFMTLPSKIPNLISLNSELNRIKSAVQEINQFHYSGNDVRIVEQFRPRAISPVVGNRDKKELRKYSGDAKVQVTSNRKLSAKFSDFKSDRNSSKLTRQVTQKSIVKYDAQNKKAKFEEMKYQEYIQITKSNKTYLNDFLSVLEDDMTFKQEKRNSYTNETTLASHGHAHEFINGTEVALPNSAQYLKQKAQASIQNSLRLIRKVKAMC